MAGLDKGSSMSTTLVNTQSDVFTALFAYLQGLFPGVPIIRGLDNNVPMPNTDSIELTPLYEKRLSTNVRSYDPDNGIVTLRMGTEYTIQVDCFGSTANYRATVIALLWRDDAAVSQFPDGITPLYADDPRQIQFQNDQNQYEERWMVEIKLQYNALVSMPYESAQALNLAINRLDMPEGEAELGLTGVTGDCLPALKRVLPVFAPAIPTPTWSLIDVMINVSPAPGDPPVEQPAKAPRLNIPAGVLSTDTIFIDSEGVQGGSPVSESGTIPAYQSLIDQGYLQFGGISTLIPNTDLVYTAYFIRNEVNGPSASVSIVVP